MDQATIPGQHLKQNCQDLAENRLPDSLLFITKAEVNLSVKDPTPLFSRSGVYLLECDECSSKYVGQTGRALDSRVKEHEGEIRSIQKRLNKRRNNEDFSADLINDVIMRISLTMTKTVKVHFLRILPILVMPSIVIKMFLSCTNVIKVENSTF